MKPLSYPIYLFLCILMCVGTSAHSSENRTDTLHFEGLQLNGLNSEQTFYTHIHPLFDLHQVKLWLSFKNSPLINTRRSNITVYVNDVPVTAQWLTDSFQTLLVEIPHLSVFYPENSVKIKLAAHIEIGDNPCQNENDPGQWLQMKPESGLILRPIENYSPDSLSLAQSIYLNKAIVYPAHPDMATIRAITLIYSFLKMAGLPEPRFYTLDNVPDNLANYIVIGKKKDFPQLPSGNYKAGRILLKKEAPTPSTPFGKAITYITGNDNAGLDQTVQAYITPSLLNGVHTSYLDVNAAHYQLAVQDNRIFLRQLNNNAPHNPVLKGNSSQTYDFKTSFFSDIPKELAIHIDITNTKLRNNQLGDASISVFLNDQLLGNFFLDEQGHTVIDVKSNAYMIYKYNTLKIQTLYNTQSGNCQDVYNYQTQINEDLSYITSEPGAHTSSYTFFNYPDMFQTPNTAILINPALAESAIPYLAQTVYNINDYFERRFITFPTIDNINNITKYQDYNLILIGTRNDVSHLGFKNMPLKFNGQFEDYNQNNNLVTYEMKEEGSNYFTEIFRGAGQHAVLLVTVPNAGMDTSEINNINTYIKQQYITALGNIIISEKGRFSVFDRGPQKTSEPSAASTTIARLWKEYKYYILGILLVCIGILYVYVRKQVNKHSVQLNKEN